MEGFGFVIGLNRPNTGKEDDDDDQNSPAIKTIPNHCCSKLKIMPATNNFEPQPF
jgi:hypothetical protein